MLKHLQVKFHRVVARQCLRDLHLGEFLRFMLTTPIAWKMKE